MSERIAFSRPCFGDAEAEAAAAVVRSGWVVGGPHLAEFELGARAFCRDRWRWMNSAARDGNPKL